MSATPSRPMAVPENGGATPRRDEGAGAPAPDAEPAATGTSPLRAKWKSALSKLAAAGELSGGKGGEDSNVQVAVRLRPFNAIERSKRAHVPRRKIVTIEGNDIRVVNPEPKTIADNDPAAFHFNFVYDSQKEDNPATNEDVYRDIGPQLLDNAFQGYNCCLFAYGQTGSGKTYTLSGTKERPDGIVPRFCQEMFQRITSLTNPGKVEFSVRISYLEIYHEKITDLLTPKVLASGEKPPILKIHNPDVNTIYVDNLTHHVVANYQELRYFMNVGDKIRTVGSTNMNATSSRSHAIFTIYLERKTTMPNGNTLTIESKINLVDLAGSERAKATGATGERLREACRINQSLTSLGVVINKLASKSNYIPYRDSQLTLLLSQSLGGSSKTIMLATISPADINYTETMSTLLYANHAMDIVNRAERVKPKEQIAIKFKRAMDKLRFLSARSPKAGGETTPTGAQAPEDLQERIQETQTVLTNIAQPSIQDKRGMLIKQDSFKTLGISVEDMQLKVNKTTPYLTNLNADPALSESLIYFLQRGTTRLGRDPSSEVVLRGFSVAKEHATIELVTDPSNTIVTLKAMEGARTFVNGQPVTQSTVLHNGDRLIFGNNHIFRYSNPKEVSTQPRDPDSEEMSDWDRALQELSESWSKSMNDPDGEPAQLLKLMASIDEANAICEHVGQRMVFSMQSMREGDERTFAVRTTDFETTKTNVWNAEVFNRRLDEKRRWLDDFWDEASGKVIGEPDPHDDPFYDPPEDKLIGTVDVPLAALTQVKEVHGPFAIATETAGWSGELNLRMFQDLEEFKDGTVPTSLAAQNGGMARLMLKIPEVQNLVSSCNAGVFVKYDFPEAGASHVTNRSSEVPSSTPSFGYKEQFDIGVSPEFVADLETRQISFEVWGHEDESLSNPRILRKRLEEKEEELERLRKKLAASDASLQESNDAMGKLKQQVKARLNKNSEATAQLEKTALDKDASLKEAEDRVRQLQERLDALQQERDAARAQIHELEAKLSEAEDRVKEGLSDVAELKEKLSATGDKHSTAEEEVDRLRKSREELRDKARKEIAKLKSDLATRVEELAASSQVVTELTAQARTSAAHLSDQSAEVNRLTVALNAAQNTIAEHERKAGAYIQMCELYQSLRRTAAKIKPP